MQEEEAEQAQELGDRVEGTRARPRLRARARRARARARRDSAGGSNGMRLYSAAATPCLFQGRTGVLAC